MAWAQLLKPLSAEKHGIEKDERRSIRSRLFFRTLLGNSMMSLNQIKLSGNQLTWVSDEEFGEFWKKMFDEFELSNEQLLKVSGLKGLMESNPAIRDSVRLRERIVLPLIAIQQFALMNLRNLDDKNKMHESRYRKLIIRCMFGIINAARNSA
jgi:phosphoenolpyruvate carboxylase